MKSGIQIGLLLAMASGAAAYAQPSMQATLYCVSPSGTIIPVLMSTGTPSQTNPPGTLAYGLNALNQAVPLACDAQGNLGVSQIIAGTNVTISPVGGTGVVTINSTAAGGGTTTNPVTFNNSGSGAASGTTFNGAAPVTVSYNTVGASPASPLPAVLTKLQAVKKGTGNMKAIWLGDSTFFSYNSSATTTQYVANSVGVKWCADLIQFYGIKCQWNTWFGGGIGLASFGTDDSRTTQGSSWTLDGSVKIIGGEALKATTNTNAYAFRPAQWSGQVGATGSTLVDANVDTCQVFYVQQPGGGVLAVNFDGGTATNINTAGTASIQSAIVAAGTLAGHTFNHLWSSGGQVDIAGDLCYDSTTSSVIVMLAGAGGINSTQMTDQSAAYGPGFSAPYAALAPDLAVVEAGLINDWNTASGINTTTSKANVQTLTTALVTAGVNVALYSPNPQNPAVVQAPTNAVQSSYVEGMRQVAAATSNTGSTATVPFIDNFNAWQSYAIASPLGWYGDAGTHPGGVGYQELATAAETATVGSILPASSFGANLTPWYNITPATSVAWTTTSVGANYTVLSTDSYLYANCSGCTVTLPATPNSLNFANGRQITIKNIGAASIVLSSPNTFNTPTSVDAGGTATVVVINGSWSGKQKWSPVAPANYLVFSYTSPGGSYTAVGTEGVIKVPGGQTTTFPFPTGAMNGFGTLVYNTSTTATQTINGSGGASYGGPSALGGGCTTQVANFNTATWVPLLSSCPLHAGLVTLVSGTATVSSTYSCTASASCVYRLTNCGVNGSTAIGTPSVGTIVVGTSFVVNAESATATVATGDVSSICWTIN